jgi:hypothetical protein
MRAVKLREGIDGVKLNANLWDAIEVTLPSMGKTAATRYRYQTSFKALQRKAAKISSATRLESPTWRSSIWKELKAAWGASGTDWMHLRRAVSAFLSKYLDLYHPFRRRVMKDFPTAKEHKRKPNVSIDQFKKIVRRVRPQLAPVFWTLAITGMRFNEYLRLQSRADLARPYVRCPAPRTSSRKPRSRSIRGSGITSRPPSRPGWGGISAPAVERRGEAAGMKNVHVHDSETLSRAVGDRRRRGRVEGAGVAPSQEPGTDARLHAPECDRRSIGRARRRTTTTNEKGEAGVTTFGFAGLLVPAGALDLAFEQEAGKAGVLANVIVRQDSKERGVMIIANAVGAEEIISALEKAGMESAVRSIRAALAQPMTIPFPKTVDVNADVGQDMRVQ